MENRYYLAIDIGASSGRHILAHKKDGRIVLEEIYRFPNGMQEHNGHKVWNVDQLFGEIQTGMKKCADIGKIPYSMGIDTCAVDFVLLDDQGQRIGDAVAYRDARTDGMDKQVYEIISENDLYEITGIQKQKFNTIYQLMALKQQNPESLDRAQSMLMIPDYFNFLLTGNKLQEYTNATTTQLVDPKANDWNWALIDRLGYPRTLFQTIMMAGSIVGNLADSIQKQVGFECKVVLPATHDTASAVMAVPSKEEQPLYISSGTWSLMGTELKEAACDEQSRKHNMTNEGGYDYRFRYLKNIMGLWMIQSVRHEVNDAYSFAEICAMAEEAKDFQIINSYGTAATTAYSSAAEKVTALTTVTMDDTPATTNSTEPAKSLAAEIQKLTGYDTITKDLNDKMGSKKGKTITKIVITIDPVKDKTIKTQAYAGSEKVFDEVVTQL